VKAAIVDYYQCPLGDLAEDVALAEWGADSRVLRFSESNSDRYKARVSVEDSDGSREEAVYEVWPDNRLGFRKTMWMNSGWEWLSIADDGTLQTRRLGEPEPRTRQGWKTCDLPFTWNKGASAKDHLCWFRKSFAVPAWLRGQRFVLQFHRIGTEGVVYLNGKKLYAGMQWTSAIDMDCTESLKLDGENELVVGVRDQIAAMDQGELANGKLSSGWIAKPTAPAAGKSGLGDVKLLTTGRAHIADVFVKTSFRKKELALEIAVSGLTNASGWRIANTVLQGGKALQRLPDIRASEAPVMEAGRPPVYRIVIPWDRPPLWGPQEFPLLQLKTSLSDDSGAVADEIDTRFGFRELWADGMKLMWNGTPVRSACSGLGGYYLWSGAFDSSGTKAQVRDGFRAARELGFTMVRHCYDWDYQADIADEEGLIIACGSACPAGPTEWILNCDEFWRNTGEYAKNMVLYLRNHPSIFTWYLSNEFLGASREKNRDRLQEVGKTVLQYDETRFIEFGCDIDLDGASPLISTHYPVDNRAIRKPDSLHLPDAFYWHPLQVPLTNGMKVPCGLNKTVANVTADSPITWGVKPIILNESCWDVFFLAPHGYSRVVGDKVYSGPGMAAKCHYDISRLFCQGHRDAEVTAINPWLGRNYARQHAIPETDIIVPQRYHSFYSGESVKFDVVLVCDRLAPATLKFGWSLTETGTGKTIADQRESIAFAPCDTHRRSILVKIPDCGQATGLRLAMQLVDRGQVLASWTHALTVYPKSHAESCASRDGIVVYDPPGTSFDTLRRILPLAGKPAELDAASLAKARILIIGANQNPSDLKARASVFLEFAAQGGVVILLHQTAPQDWLPFPLIPGARAESVNFSYRETHPLFRGLSGDDLCYWYPGHQVVSNYFAKPEKGNCNTLIEAGGPRGMIYAAMVEEPWGRGRIIASQLDLLSNIDQNPLVLKVWKSLTELPSSPTVPPAAAGFLGDPASPVRKTLIRTGVDFKDIGQPEELAGLSTVIIDGQKTFEKTEIEALQAFVEKGGSVLWHGVDESNRATAGRLAGCAVKEGVPPPPFWNSRAMRIVRHPLLEGLTDFDLLWKKFPGTDEGNAIYRKSHLDLGPIGKSTVSCDKGHGLLYPAYLWVVDNGKGRVILDNVLWDVDASAINSISDRYLTALLNNLGVRYRVTTLKKTPATPGAAKDRDADRAKPPASAKGPERQAVSKEALLDMVKNYESVALAGNTNEAAAVLDRIRTASPIVPEVYLKLGYVFENARDWKRAIDTYERLLAAEPAEMEGYMRLGKCWEMLDEYPKAVRAYERGLDFDPNHPPLIAARNRASEKLGK
jgi:hypothetical protein